MIGRGWALVDAEIGDNRPHRHLAVQISLGVDGPLTAYLAEQTLTGRCLIIAARTLHRLAPQGQRVRSLYVEPYGALARNLGARAAAAGGAVADDTLMALMIGHTPSLLNDLRADAVTIDPRVLVQHSGLAGSASRPSKSRMRALCQAELGASPSRLRQWLRLQVAMRALSRGAGIAEAALDAGFADQAHFTRLLVRWFGITPGRGLAQLEITVTD